MHLFSIQPLYQEDTSSKLEENQQVKTYKYNEVVKEIGFGKYQYKIVATVALLNCALGVYIALTSFLIPMYKADMYINKWEVGILISSQSAGSLIGGVLFSYLSDIWGRKFSLVFALITVISCSIVCATLHNFPLF
jgi:predicted MFS family arabinose efflux permease